MLQLGYWFATLKKERRLNQNVDMNSSVHMLLPFTVGRVFSHDTLIIAGLDVQKVSRRSFTSSGVGA